MPSHRFLEVVSAVTALLALAHPATAQPTLTIEGDCPGELRVQADGMHHREEVRLYFSPERGSYTFPPFHQCYGVEVGLSVRRLYYLGSVRADDFGTAVWSGSAGSAACGGFLQAMDRLCAITNVAQIP